MGERVSFSPCGNYLAHFNAAGKLRVWETKTNFLKQEFTPGSHLSAPCSSMTWVPVSKSTGKLKNKKRKLSNENQLLLLVLGTDVGRIYFFSLVESDVVASLSVSNSPVTAITALPGTDLYSGSAKIVTQWNISDKTVKSKWKCNDNICTMLVSEDNSLLLTALSSSVVCWNIESRTVFRRFDGHKSNVVCLSLNVAPSGEKYLFSAAAEDRLVNVWNLSSEFSKSMAMFTLPDIPSGISSNIDSNGLVTLTAVSKRGSLHIYSHQLNGQCYKPLKPRTTVLVTADESRTANKTELIPIIAGKVIGKDLKIAFGNCPFISCESLDLNTNESELFLIRKDPRRSAKKKDESVKKVVSAETSGNIEYLSPATVNSVSLKRDRDAIDSEQRETMSTLLEKMNISSSKEPTGDALAHLLVQGLNSQDRDILRSVLFTQNERKIKSTVERLPAQAVLPLLKILNNLIQGKTWISQVAAMWLQAILRTHVSQLLADENCSSVIVPLLGMVERRLTCLGQLCQLKGRLDLILDQATSSSIPTEPLVDIPPLLVYQDIDSPASSNCLLEDEEDNDSNDHGDDDDGDKWSDLLNDMSAESDNDNNEDDSDNLSNKEDDVGSENSEEDMETSS